MSGQWFTYQMGAIDHRWEFLPTVEEIMTRLVSSIDDRLDGENQTFPSLKKFLSDWDEAKKVAVGWEGDFSKGPCVFSVPNEISFRYGFVWQQHNNGQSFIISPVALPHLDEFAW